MKRFILFTTAIFGLMASAQTTSDSKIYIDVGQAQIKKSLMALPSFQYFGSPGERSAISVGTEIFGVVSNDMAVTGLFTFIKPDAYLEDPAKTGLRPAGEDGNGFKFSNWKTIGAEFLVRAGFRISGGEISLEGYVYDVNRTRSILSKTYKAPTSQARRLAHSFSNDIVEALTGKPGMFMSRIVVSSNRGAIRKGKEIWVMDWDGANAKQITAHRNTSFSPAWSPDGEKVVYTSFAYHAPAKTRNTDLFMYNLQTEKRTLLSYRKGINSGATFFPNGSTILLTLSRDGNPDMYKMNTDGEGVTRLTFGPGGVLNLEPDVSWDGSKIAFSSTKSGRPMIYTMNANGEPASWKRLTFAGTYNSTPEFSPDGKKIVFAGLDKTNFDIFLMNVDGTGLERLTSSKKPNGRPANNQDPTFSPDGRHIIFSSNRTGNYQLYITDLKGIEERRITFDNHDYSQPRWSTQMK